MRSIMTFYIKNCTFLYYFIQYFFLKIKATLPFITVPGQLVQRHLVQGRLIQGCLVQRQKVKTDTWSKGHLVHRTEGTKTDGPIKHLVQQTKIPVLCETRQKVQQLKGLKDRTTSTNHHPPHPTIFIL